MCRYRVGGWWVPIMQNEHIENLKNIESIC